MPEAARVLVIGESLIDALPDREVVGGSPANIALGLGRLGVPVRLHTAFGDDERGRCILSHLEESAVQVTASSCSLARTSVAQVNVGSDGSASYRFDLDSSLAPWKHEGEAVVHIGSISAFTDPGASMIEEFLANLDGEALVTFDPNIRADLMPDAARERFRRLCARVHMLKMSDEDASWLFPQCSIDEVVEELLAAGPRVVVITLGADGLRLHAAGVDVHVRPQNGRVVDTVGAGDTVMAALIACLTDGEPVDAAALRRVGEFAARAAAITVGRDGADLPWASELSP